MLIIRSLTSSSLQSAERSAEHSCWVRLGTVLGPSTAPGRRGSSRKSVSLPYGDAAERAVSASLSTLRLPTLTVAASPWVKSALTSAGA